MDWDFGDVFLAIATFVFWMVFLAMFISAFTDVFRRRDLSGWVKAAWTVLMLVFPLVGVLIYMVARPESLADEMYETGRYSRAPVATSPFHPSPADEIAKLGELHEKGQISDDEHMRLRSRVIG
jgi:predicted membrane channel-forming protein YqfA (hemolysin III family)